VIRDRPGGRDLGNRVVIGDLPALDYDALVVLVEPDRGRPVVAAYEHLIAPHWLDWLLGPPAAVQATLFALVGICSVVLALRHWRRLERAQLMVKVLTDRVPSNARAGQAKLSSREHEVLDLIRSGITSDGEIARTLQISPTTAATHVQNILRKTELHNRHDLMLLPRRARAM
jgi:DNA-binding CsgD family transcriptional regulator